MGPMTFDEYQQKALATAIVHQDPLMDKTILAMGVAGEAGEMLEKWKKVLMYQDGVATGDNIQEIGKELTDVVWYVAVLAERLGLSFDDIMQQNVQKLASRKARGVQKGAGDNR